MVTALFSGSSCPGSSPSWGHCFVFSAKQICPGLNADEIKIPYDKHLKVSSLVKVTKTQTIDRFSLVHFVFQMQIM